MTDGDGLYIMRIHSKDLVHVRNEGIRVEDLGRRLAELFQTRAERLLLVKVEGQVDLGAVIQVLDRASSQVRLQYGLITETTTPTPAEPSLFMSGKLIYTQEIFMPQDALPVHPVSQ
jgi:hypothetical protein